MDSEDDMHDALETSEDDYDQIDYEESLDDADAAEEEGTEPDYTFDENDQHVETSAPGRGQVAYTVLTEKEIKQRQEEAIASVVAVLSISKDYASILLRNYGWSVSRVNDEWFADESKVRKRLGLLDKSCVQLRPDITELKCGICFDYHPTERMLAAVCLHFFCKLCWTGYVHTSINDGAGCLSLRCPNPDCSAAIGEDLVLSVLTEDDKSKYYRYALRSYVENNRKVKWCPAPGCEFAVEYTPGSGLFDICCKCGYNFCWNCLEEAHRPVDCATVAQWIRKNSAESENMNWILANSKPCPKCKRPIEKNQGCMHITCTPPCKFDFCWLCLGPWSEHGERTGGFYACNRYEAEKKEGKHDETERRREMAKNSLERYTHYYERWASNESSRAKALSDLQQMQAVQIEKLSDRQCQPVSQLKFVTDAWLQIVECRRVLKWTYAYGYYVPEHEVAKKQFFEYLQGVRHLKELAECGLTHIHLLPSFDFASVDEKKENWQSVDEPRLLSLPPDSEEQQRAIVAIQDEDGYNWGYDPVSWGVPEGSYSTDPNGSKRCLEFREMIQALNKLGLRVILDVVYNHLHGKGPYDKFSVLDKVVPGYYLRRNLQGEIENSTCMNNTASEHYMVDRLIVDDLRHWVVDYKVDGFRFDLMGHLMKKTMLHAKRTLQSLTLEHDGVDGSNIYLYGEGWDFGEVAGNARGINASQHNLAGTGIGSFNDRIRDAAMGGSPFADPRQQGFLTGLFLKPNTFPQGDEMTMRKALLAAADSIQVGLAGNLRDYIFLDHNGNKRRGVDLLTNDGRSVAYAASPEETINYVSAHDNETLFDIIMLKTSEDVSLADRCRINTLASSIVAFSQGVPFFHAGDDLLRSKSLDRDSYNSGDWFNRLDFTYETNNWGVGLPPKEKNGTKWNIMRKLLSDSSLKPNKMDIIFAKECFKTLLRIRYSSPLFRLRTATEVKERVKFYNNGPSQIPGVAVMSIEDGHEGLNTLSQLDALYQTIIILFNARPDTVSIFLPLFQSRKFSLHPLQMDSVDEIVKKSEYDEGSGFFSIPARTTAVFVESRYSS